MKLLEFAHINESHVCWPFLQCLSEASLNALFKVYNIEAKIPLAEIDEFDAASEMSQKPESEDHMRRTG